MSIANELRKPLRDWQAEGLDELEILARYITSVDDALCKLFETHFGEQCQSACLLAIGGYGRGMLHPYSDIDVLLLVDDTTLDEQVASDFITALWDTGFDIGHSVRNVTQCIEESTDLTIMTALFERRFLAGATALNQSLNSALLDHPHWTAQRFSEAKMGELRDRHSKESDGSRRVEPNLKTAPGALRDLHTLRWIGLAVLKTGQFEDWAEMGFLRRKEADALVEADAFFNRLRAKVHLLIGRKEDRLTLDIQQRLADADSGSNDNRAIEMFMRQGYYHYANIVDQLAHLSVQKFNEHFISHHVDAEPLNDRFVLRGDTIHVKSNDVFKRYPPALLEIYVVTASDPRIKQIGTETIRAIHDSLHLIDDTFREEFVPRKLFMELLRQPSGVSHQLLRMHRHGVLRRYWPDFDKITGLMQFDMFHIYCVDEHTLWVVRYLQRMQFSKYSEHYPIAARVAKTVDPALLFMMGLCHDIAKGRDGDHSIVGAPIAYEFALRHGVGEQDARLVEWVVRHHLLLSTTAQKQDISDPDVIESFANIVGTKERLIYLFLLTIADIQGTQPALWNSWRQSLIRRFYHLSASVLAEELNTDELIDRRRKLVLEKLCNSMSENEASSLLSLIGDEGLRSNSSAEMAWQLERLRDNRGEAFIELVNFDDHGSTTMVVHHPDQPFLLARVFAELARRQISVLSASILTTSSVNALDKIRITDRQGEIINDPNDQAMIKRWVMQALDAPYKPALARQPKNTQALKVDLSVDFEPLSDTELRMLVTAKSQPGLLAAITAAIARADCNIINANIASFGEKAEDSFVISPADDKTPTSETLQTDLKEAIREAISELSHA